MKYVKASAVLPQALLEELQKYAEGELIYVPRQAGSRRAWGEKTGSRRETAERNAAIRQAYREGVSISTLAGEYCLCEDTIKKIVYQKEK